MTCVCIYTYTVHIMIDIYIHKSQGGLSYDALVIGCDYDKGDNGNTYSLRLCKELIIESP